VDKRKGEAHAGEAEAMDVAVDIVAIDTSIGMPLMGFILIPLEMGGIKK
jgi:hypothetical protein